MGGVGWVWGTGSYTVRQNLHSCVILVMVRGMGKGGREKHILVNLHMLMRKRMIGLEMERMHLWL